MAVASNGAYSHTDAAVTSETGDVFAAVNYGDGYAALFALDLEPRIDTSPATEQEYADYVGRDYPVLYTGPRLSLAMTVSGDVTSDASRQALRALGRWPGPAVYRDRYGERWPVGVRVSGTEGAPRVTHVTLELTAVDA